jgi:2-iminobutanoate/2-iminopropanoate deaminase
MDKEIILTPDTDASSMIFSPAVRAGNLLFLSGSAGLDKEGNIPGEDIESQARQAMENLGEVLEAAGSSWDKVVKVHGYLTRPDRDFPGWNKIFKEYFPENPPARTTVGASLLKEEWLIEVDVIALV